MFQGRWPNILTVDAKNRLALPAPFRQAGSGDVGDYMIGSLEDPCIYVHTAAQHQAFLDRLAALGETRQSRRVRDFVLWRFEPVTADAQGRITIPSEMIAQVGIQREVCLISQEALLEFWANEVFARVSAEVQASGIADVLEAVFAEEEQERRLQRRAASSAREGNSPTK